MLEAMGYMGWEFNLANLFAVPILIGTGVDGASGTGADTVAAGLGRSAAPSSAPTAIPNMPTVRSGSDSSMTTGRVAVL